MKLVSRILLHLVWTLSPEMDDSLALRAETILTRYLAGQPLPEAESGANGYLLRDIPESYAAVRPKELFSDEKIHISERDAREPARVLRTLFRDGAGAWHELTMMTPSVGRRTLTQALLRWVVALYAILLLLILVVTVWVLRRTMRPLYALLRWLDDYTVGAQNPPLAADTTVEEFRRLNEAAQRYAARAESLFERQKQFIGNASHEMQTPLAVCRNRLELLVDDPSLTERQLGEIAKVQQTLGYLVRLNRSLLLLTKIENGQFPESSEVDIAAIVSEQLPLYDEIYASRGIVQTMRIAGPLVVEMNESLATILVTNLLKNAYVHTAEQGHVEVSVHDRTLEVYNDGTAPLDADHIFERFYQGTKKEGSTGLGLALVSAVGRYYGLRVAYRFVEGRHCFTVVWP